MLALNARSYYLLFARVIDAATCGQARPGSACQSRPCGHCVAQSQSCFMCANAGEAHTKQTSCVKL
eukprot:1162129-Pelagomonas_calceolata.AAC.3